jgi:hypothetical protein
MNSFEIALKALDEQDEKGIGIEGVKAMQLCNAADELLAALEKIYNAHASGNNGAYMGEAHLCGYFAAMCKHIIAKAKGEV